LRRAALLSLAALALAGCGTGGLAPEEGANVADGKLLFTQRCGGCHTLREAGIRP
jgi:mono/diheme cytochrome c family protein